MPEIIVTAAGPPTGAEGVLLRERVSASDFESERFAANLVERLGWAVEDATEVERRGPITGRVREQRVEQEPKTEREPAPSPEPAGV